MDMAKTPAKTPVKVRQVPSKQVSEVIEKIIFHGRWVLAPVYLGMLVTLVVLAFKFIQELVLLVSHVSHSSMHEVTLQLLSLLDITLLGNLVLIMIFSGYENFVSKIGVSDEHEDRPHWMGNVDYSGLKIKLVGSLVAISMIELLRDFMEADSIDHETVKWRILIHLTFVVSGLLFSFMDYMADKRHALIAETENL